jgi:hypothetical protein
LGQNSRVKPPSTPKKSTQYESAVYWFRDYWSSRLRLNRNVHTEEFDIDTKKDALPGELTTENVASGKCKVKWAGDQFVELVEPFELAHQYEPRSISFPFSKSGIRDESPDPNYRIDSELVKNIVSRPLVQNVGEQKLWLSILFRVIIPSILFLIVEAIILSYVANSNPELTRFSFIIMAASVAVFLYFALAVFVKTGISESTRKVLGAKATIYFYNGQQAEKFHYRYPKDIPDWLEAKPYWVFRYLYSWSFELSPGKGFPLIRAVKDVERLDIWLDAKSGVIEWIVSDYHWRELWYKADPRLENINVWVLRNFHTLRPLTISISGKGTFSDLYTKGNSLSKLWMENIERYKSVHSTFFSRNKKNKKLGIGDRLLFSTLNDLWWEKWRYEYGANDATYKKPDFPATGEQPSLPEFASIIIPRQKPTTTVITPTVRPLKTPSASLIGTPASAVCQTTASTVKPMATLANAVIPTSSLSTTRKHAHRFLYMGIAAAVIATTGAATSYWYMKKRRMRARDARGASQTSRINARNFQQNKRTDAKNKQH